MNNMTKHIQELYEEYISRSPCRKTFSEFLIELLNAEKEELEFLKRTINDYENSSQEIQDYLSNAKDFVDGLK